jgi:DhnA family fructose-bisphosphate aldolase class Ia
MNAIRARRVFGSDGRSVIVALDHAAFLGPLPGLDAPGELIASVAEAGADAVLTSYGVARAFGGCLGRMGLILRADGGSTTRNPRPADMRRAFSAAEALRLGADAVVCMGMVGFPEEASSLRVLTELVNDCAPWGLPVLAEMLAAGKNGGHATAADIGYAVRVGIELGADWIKTSYAGPAVDYAAALRGCYRPVVVLGGSKADSDVALLESIAEAIDAGASGVAIGRNIWQHANPGGLTRALVALAHGGASVDAALAALRA